MEKEILTMEEAAELFGVSVKTFIKLLKEEKVPARKIGREWRFSRRALIDWLSVGDSQTYSASEGETTDFFNSVAPEWDAMRKDYFDESIKKKLVDLNILKKTTTLIDLGSGDGYIARAVAKQVKKVIAIDMSGEMLKELKRKMKEEGIKNIETIESDGQDVPVEDGVADVVCANMYLHHIEEPELAIKEMFRLVKLGGTVFLADLHTHTDTQLKEKMHDVWSGFDDAQVRKWFEKNGFKDIKMETIHDVREGSAGKSIFVLTALK